MSITQVEQIACFVHDASFDHFSQPSIERFKLHVLDTLGCAIGALGSEPTRAVRRMALRTAEARREHAR